MPAHPSPKIPDVGSGRTERLDTKSDEEKPASKSNSKKASTKSNSKKASTKK